MTTLIEQLKQQYVIRPGRLQSLRQYIERKYPNELDSGIDQVYFNALESAIGRHMIPVEENLHEIIKKDMLSRVLESPEIGLTNACILEKTVHEIHGRHGGVSTETIKAITNWVESAQVTTNDERPLRDFVLDWVEAEERKIISEGQLKRLILYEQLHRVKKSCNVDVLKTKILDDSETIELDVALENKFKENLILEIVRLKSKLHKHIYKSFSFLRVFVINYVSKLELNFDLSFVSKVLCWCVDYFKQFKHYRPTQLARNCLVVAVFIIVTYAYQVENVTNLEIAVDQQTEVLEGQEQHLIYLDLSWEEARFEHQNAQLKRAGDIRRNISSDYNPFPYSEQNWAALRSYLESYNSILAESPYFEIIIDVSMDKNIDPRILFAITGQEQSFVRKSSSNAARIANNPFNVHSSWKAYNTEIRDSAEIAANTVLNVMKRTPRDVHPIKALNKVYAEDERWWIGVDYFYNEMIKLQYVESVDSVLKGPPVSKALVN